MDSKPKQHTLHVHMIADEVIVEGHCVMFGRPDASGNFAVIEFSGSAGDDTPDHYRVAMPMKFVPIIVSSLIRLIEAQPDPDRN